MRVSANRDAGNNSARAEKLFAASLFVLLTVVMSYPYSVHPASGVLTIGTDTDYCIWALGWDVHAFLHQPFSIFDANIFFPFKHTLAWSENLACTHTPCPGTGRSHGRPAAAHSWCCPGPRREGEEP